MVYCQVFGCTETATVRCDNGFALCRKHREHNHGKSRDGYPPNPPQFRRILSSGEFIPKWAPKWAIVRT